MISKPYSINVSGKVYDANSPINITWQIAGSIQTSFSISIIDNSTGVVAWSLPQMASYALQYMIPSHSLTNGKQYKVTVTVWSSDGSSANSDPVICTCTSVPIVTISPIGTVGNQSNQFQANYLQAENVSLSNWIAILYDNNYNILQQSSLQTTTNLTYTFGGFNSGITYYVEFQATSNLGLTGTTGKIQFIPDFSQPNLNATITATNTNDCGINLQWFINQIIGQSLNSPTYINNQKIDLTTNKTWFNQGFNIDEDFTLKLWIENVRNYQFTNSTIITASNAAPVGNINTLWLFDSNKTTPTTMGISVSNVAPTHNNNLWVVDTNQTTERASGVIIDTTQPATDVIWVNSVNPINDIYLLKLVGDNGTVTLEYSNGSFNLYTIINNVKTLTSSYVVSGSSYYIYIQQINGVLSLNGSQPTSGNTSDGDFLSVFQTD